MLDPITAQSQLLDLTQLKPDWRILAAVGSSENLAIPVAPHVNHVTQICATAAQAQEIEQMATKATISNIACSIHAADDLPYEANSFDLLLCHQFTHRMINTEAWLLQTARVLKSRGLIAISTYLVPGTRLRGKKARQLRLAAEYVNAFCQLRDPTHRQYYSQSGWEDLLLKAGFEIQQVQTAERQFDFSLWAGEAALSPKDRLRLKAMLVQAPEKAHEFLTPQFSGDRIRFRLPEITILATSKGNTD